MDTTSAPFPGLMMEQPLLLKHFIERAERFYSAREIVSYRDGRRNVRTVGQTIERARRLASSLARLGVGRGDRVATFCWNTQEHLELYLAVPAMGAVLHPVNIRLHTSETSYILDHAEDRIIFIDTDLADRVPSSGVQKEVLIGAGHRPQALGYEDLIDAGDPLFEFPDLPEQAAASMCYTGGTTGTPKGVVYSHRSTVLHTLQQCLPDFYNLRESDVILPIVPMFHANAWGLPFAAMMVGASMVLPGEASAPRALAQILSDERVTFAAAITTIWHGIAQLEDLPSFDSLREVIAGGASLSEELLRRLDGKGIHALQGYGMTELNPLLSVGRPPARLEPRSGDWYRARLAQGRPVPLVEVKTDARADGELLLRGNTVASSYYSIPTGADARFEDGWMRTGDIVVIDDDGLIHVVDRTKDLVKSGGEWISSVELENAIALHPAVLEACVVAVPDDLWGERPLAFVTVRPGMEVSSSDLREFLGDRVAKWWIPETITFTARIAKTSIGKFDKKLLRTRAEELKRAERTAIVSHDRKTKSSTPAASST